MIRQIIVFTKSKDFDTSQLLKSAAEHLSLPIEFLNPFNEGLEHSVTKDDFLIIRTSGVLFDDWDLNYAEHLELNTECSLSHPIETLRLLRDKEKQALWYKRSHISHVPTLIHRGELTQDKLEKFSSDTQHWVIKTTRGNKGIGVDKLSTTELLERWKACVTNQDQRYIIQPFIEGQQEFRLLILGEKKFVLEKSGSHWRKNADVSEFKASRDQTLNERFISFGEDIQERLACPCFAIDFFWNGSEETIIEINANPGLTSASKALPEIDLGLAMLNGFGIG